MNAGLSNLATLKAALLPEAMRTGTDYDQLILQIGLGVARLLDRECNRNFVRTSGATYECTADREHVTLPRYPIEEVTKLELRVAGGEDWVEQTLTSAIDNRALDRGMIYLSQRLGTYRDRLIFTYTGGYFVETLEPDDEEYPSDLPEGATAVPDDVLQAWLLQCEYVWQQKDKLGLSIGEQPDKIYTGALSKIKLLDGVRELLRTHVRYELT